jgi:hypothetical protein
VPDLKDQKEVAALIQRINAASDELEETYGIPLGLVIIDTMAAAFTFDDENDNSEASSMIKVMKDIGKATGAIVVPVHHYGKASTGGLRGASAFHGGTDVVLSVLAEIDRTEGTVSDRRLSLTKSREDEMGPIAPFDLHYVEIGTHKDGESYGSCYVEPLLDRAGEANKAKTKKESASLTAFRKSFTETKLTPICIGNDGLQGKAAQIGDVKEEFLRHWTTGEGDPEKRKDAARNAFKRGLKEALKTGFATGCQDNIEWVWHPEATYPLGRTILPP